MRRRHGMTILELLVVIAATLILIAILLPSLAGSTCAWELKDGTQLKQIHTAFVVWANQRDGRYPIPGLVNRLSQRAAGSGASDLGPENIAKNLTRHLYSVMIIQNYFDPGLIVGPTEPNPRITVHADYNYENYRPIEDVFWDGDDSVDGAGERGGMLATLDGNGDEPCHASYAHLALFGEAKRVAWRDTMDAGQPVLCNRMPWIRATEGPEFEDSFALMLHGDDDTWLGNVAYADNHVELRHQYPDGNDALGMTKSINGGGFQQYHEELDR